MNPEAQYTAIVLAMGNNTGIEIPPQVIADLGAGQRPTVCVTVGQYCWSATAGVMAGKHLISLSKAHRDASGLAAGDRVQVHLRVLSAPREVLVSDTLAAALHQANLRESFDALNYSTRKEHARTVSEAKAEATRDRRISKILELLTGAHPAD